MNNEQLKKLVCEMTLEEKAGQLAQFPIRDLGGACIELTGNDTEAHLSEEQKWQVGSVLGKMTAAEMLDLQKTYLSHNRLGIPLLFMHDVIHGYRTIFPVPLALSCTWDEKLLEQIARIGAEEASATGYHVTFSPMADLVRDPRWGRVVESFGEDPILSGRLAAAMVRGYQGNGLEAKNSLASCVKHFAGHGASEGGREYTCTEITECSLRNYYLPAYKAALDAGAHLLMTSFNANGGITATANKHLLQDILRDEWKYNGVIISDWNAIGELLPHGLAENRTQAAKIAIENGTEIDMCSSVYLKELPKLCRKHPQLIAYLDTAVLHVLQLKNELGLFEDPFRGVTPKKASESILTPAYRAKARSAAQKSAVLLKNDNILPLKPNSTVALLGPLADSHNFLSQWALDGHHEDVVTLFEGLRQKTIHIQRPVGESIEEAVALTAQCDYAVLALGEEEWMSGEAGSRADLGLPQGQLALLRAVHRTGVPVIVIVFSGRPLVLTDVVPEADALMEAWLPGIEGGNALSDLLMGDASPEGRISMSFPYSVGQIPVYYNNLNTGRPATGLVRAEARYLDIPNKPLFPFGFGLSYTEFSYGELELEQSVMTAEQPIGCHITITNVGSLFGIETVQMYFRDLAADISRPVCQLADFQKIALEPGQSVDVHFTLYESQLRYTNSQGEYKSDPGFFHIMVGPNSEQLQSRVFELK